MDNPKISVIVPVYNVEQYIERCLRFIINQTFTSGVECILVNDCTPDNSIKIAESIINQYKGNIQFRIISHESNKGIAAVRNSGLGIATGDYILFIDSDDYIELNMLEEMYSEALKTNADIVISDYFIENSQQRIYRHLNIKAKKTIEYLSKTLIDSLPAFVWNKMFKREIFTGYNFAIPKEIKSMGEDLFINVFCFYYARTISYLPHAYVHYCRENVTSYCNKLNDNSLESQKSTIDSLEKIIFKDLDSSSPLFFPFMEAKNRVKTAILYNGSKTIKKKYRNLYKEAQSYIFNYDIRNKKQKMILVLNIISPLCRDIYVSLLKLGHKFRMKIKSKI